MITKSKILVTGGAGFIGSALVRFLLKGDNDIIIFDDFSVGSRDNIKDILNDKHIKIIKGDIRIYRSIQKAIDNVDYIFHLAVQCLGESLVRPKYVNEVNVTGTLNLCMASLKNRSLKRFTYVSSSEVYGTAKYIPMDENHPLIPSTPYGVSKAAGELYARSFHIANGLPIVIVRPFNTYGPRARLDRYSAVIPNFVNRVMGGLPPIIYGDGSQTRDFTYVSDTVEGMVLAAESDALVGDVVNIASGKETSVNELANIILKMFNAEHIKPIYHGSRIGDIQRHLGDISKAKKILGYKPKIPVEEGIRLYAEWLKNK